MQRKYMIWSILIVCSFFYACSPQSANESSQTDSVAKIQTVEVVKPQNRSFNAEILVSGTAHANQTVMVYAMESGMIVKLNKDIGDRVKKGETIAVLENPQLNELVSDANAALAVGQAHIKTKEAELMAAQAKSDGLQSLSNRLSKIYEQTPQLTNISDLESAQAASAESKAMVDNKTAMLDAQKQINIGLNKKLEAANTRKGYLHIKAPFSGVVTKRMVDIGSLLQNGLNQKDPQAIVEIQDTHPIRLVLPVPETDAVYIKKGMAANISFPEFSGSSFDAKVSRSSKSLDVQSKTMQVEIDVDNKEGNILSGMYAKALLQVGSRDDILSLPIISKVRFQNEDYVLAVKDDIVQRIPVKVGLTDKDYFEVMNDDLDGESLIIVSGKSLVNPGQKVKVVLR